MGMGKLMGYIILYLILLGYFSNTSMFPLFLQLPDKKVLDPNEPYTYIHVSDKNKFLSVSNFGIPSVVV